MASKARWHVLGRGAVGCLWAAHLRAAGFPVALLQRGAGARRTARVEVCPAWACGAGEPRPSPWAVEVDVEAVAPPPTEGGVAGGAGDARPIDRLLLATKAPDAAAALRAVAPRLQAGAVLVLLQNGMGVSEQIMAEPAVAQRRPNLLLGSTTNGSYLLEEFRVAHAGRGQTWIGPWGSCDLGLYKEAVGELELAGLGVERDPQIELRVWRKLACNSVLNPMTALARCKNGAAISRPELRRSVEAVSREVAGVMAACGVIGAAEVSKVVGELTEFTIDTARRNAENYSSMYQDVRQGRPTEVDFMNGYIMARAAEHGLPVPITASLFGLVKVLESTSQSSTPREPGASRL